jgi:hypothetical protein
MRHYLCYIHLRCYHIYIYRLTWQECTPTCQTVRSKNRLTWKETGLLLCKKGAPRKRPLWQPSPVEHESHANNFIRRWHYTSSRRSVASFRARLFALVAIQFIVFYLVFLFVFRREQDCLLFRTIAVHCALMTVAIIITAAIVMMVTARFCGSINAVLASAIAVFRALMAVTIIITSAVVMVVVIIISGS